MHSGTYLIKRDKIGQTKAPQIPKDAPQANRLLSDAPQAGFLFHGDVFGGNQSCKTSQK